MTVEDDQTISEMEKHGDAFVKQLARLARSTTETNLEALKEAFQEEWEAYRSLALSK